MNHRRLIEEGEGTYTVTTIVGFLLDMIPEAQVDLEPGRFLHEITV